MNIEDLVSELQKGLPGLKKRAHEAAEEAQHAKEQANAQCYSELRGEMYRALVYTLDIDAGTAAAVVDAAREGTKSASVGDSLDGRDENLVIRVTVDGLVFRGHYERKKIMDGSASGANKEFKGEDVFDDAFVFEWQAPSASNYKVTSLAHLGKLLKEKLR